MMRVLMRQPFRSTDEIQNSPLSVSDQCGFYSINVISIMHTMYHFELHNPAT